MIRSLALAVTLASGFALSAVAQTPAAPAAAGPAKVAVIFFQTALAQTNEGQRSFADLQKKYEPKRAQFKTLSDEIENLNKELQAQGAKMTEEERAKRTKAIETKKKQAQRFGEDAQAAFQGEMQELYGGLSKKVYEVLASYSEQHGYTLVMDGSQQEQPVLLWANPSTDITKAIVEAYNVKSGVPAPPAAPAAH